MSSGQLFRELERRLATVDQRLIEAGPILSVPRPADELLGAVIAYMGDWLAGVARLVSSQHEASASERVRLFREHVIVLTGHYQGSRRVPCVELLGAYFNRAATSHAWANLLDAVEAAYPAHSSRHD